MECRVREDLKQHSFDVATIGHALAVINNNCTNSAKVDPAKVVMYAMYHDMPEVFTGDIPTPIKYFGGGEIKSLLDTIEKKGIEKLISSLPPEMREDYREAFAIPAEYKPFVKAADQIAALMKCREEIAAGNSGEFIRAAERLEDAIASNELEAVRKFVGFFGVQQTASLDSLIEDNGAWLLED